jgi:hypothetical protein
MGSAVGAIAEATTRLIGLTSAAVTDINTLNDLWNWPNNPLFGYANDVNDWKADNSAGLSKRVNDILTYKYADALTGNLHYTNDLSITRDELNRGFAVYKHYFQSFGDTENPTFHKFARYPIVEWNIRPNGRTIGGIHYELNSSTNMPQIRVQFTHAHEFGNGDEIEFFGFDNDSTGRPDRDFNTKRAFVSIVDGFNVVLHEDSALTKLEQFSNFHSQGDFFLTALDDAGGSDQAVLHFDEFQETFVTGDVLQVAVTPANLTGTMAASSGTLLYLEKISGSNSYLVYTDSSRSTHATITSGQGKANFSTSIPINIPSSGVTKNIQNLSLAGGTFATLRGEIEGQNMSANSPSEDTTNIFRGFCRVQLTAGSGVNKTIPTSMDKTAYFGYKYDKSAETITILKDPTIASRDSNILTATNGSGNITGNIEIIDYWSYKVESPALGDGSANLPTSGVNVGGMLFTGQVNDTSLTPITPLTHPLASEASTLYSGNKTTNDDNQNFSILYYQLKDTVTRSPGRRKYQYQNSSNATVNGAVYDFTKFWRPNTTSAFTPSYHTTPTGTPDLSSQGYIDGTNTLTTFPHRGLFTLAQLGLTSSVNSENTATLSGTPVAKADGSAGEAKPYAHELIKVGVFPINPKADEYVAPTAYAPDVFDTDDEWDTDGFSQAKINETWPKIPMPRSIKFTTNQPSSVTRSQNGTKYVRSSGVIKHQMEVEYAPMSENNFRHFHSVVQAARGQATPFYFDLRNYTNNSGTSGRSIFGQITASGNTRSDRGLTSDSFLMTTIDQSLDRKPTTGDKLITLEGFDSNRSDVFIQGEQLILNAGYADGNLVTVINDGVDSNRYGEARIRIPYGLRRAVGNGEKVFFDPSHVIVTLADDQFEFTREVDGLYRITVRFDFDEFK